MQEGGWERCAAPFPLRTCQSAALDRLESQREQGRTGGYVVLPAGAGKTVVGLELARRLGRRTLVITPNTAVQGQWLRQWEAFGGPGVHPQPASGGRLLKAGLTVLTTQSLSVWDRTADDEDEPDDTSPGIAERRRVALRDPDGHDLLSLLHPRGRDLVEATHGLGPWTLVLDECHHLLETWGPLVPALVRALGEDTWVLGLTATPPEEATPRAKALRDRLFDDSGTVSAAIPAVVKDGGIAPFQELVLFTEPSAEEDAWLTADRTRFAGLQTELVGGRAGSLPLLDWLWRRLHDRRPAGAAARATWQALDEAEPELACAGLRLAHAGLLSLPSGARLSEQHRVPADASDWAVLLGAYAGEHLVHSRSRADTSLLRSIREVLPSLGFELTATGLRSTTSPVDMVCALSTSKAVAGLKVVAAEHAALGADLRALLLCDVEVAAVGRLPAGQGSARSTFLALARSELAEVLRPVLCTGRTLALRREDLTAFRAQCPPHLADRLLAEPLDGIRSMVRVEAGAGWSARVWVPLVTRWLAEGGTRAVVSTRGMLGEGWDCPSLNVVVDLSSASSATAVTQLRGRALRLDPDRPDKVADCWTVVCVADDHPRGGADHLRAVRKHRAHLAPGRDGLVESGIGHCDTALGPYAPPDAGTRAAVNARALARPADRAGARTAWSVGGGYAGRELATLRLDLGAPLGLPGRVVPASLLSATTTLGAPAPAPLPPGGRPRRLWPLPVGGAVVAAAAATAGPGPAVGAAAGLATGLLLGGGVAGGRYRSQRAALTALPADLRVPVLRQLAGAVADALHDGGGSAVGASGVRITTGPIHEGAIEQGRAPTVAVELEAGDEQSRRFADALDELLAPLAEPRWLVSRLVLAPPTTAAERHRLARACALGSVVEAAVVWHAVPSWCGTSRARVEAFETAWRRHLGAGRLVLARDPEGVSLLELLRGEDVLAVTSRRRTTWR